MHSLRLKLVLLSTVLSGIILVALSVVTWRLIENTRHDRADLEIMKRFSRVVRDLHPRADFDQVSEDLEATFGAEIEEGTLLLFVEDRIEDESIFFAPSTEWQRALPGDFTLSEAIPPRRPDWAFHQKGPPPHPDDLPKGPKDGSSKGQAKGAKGGKEGRPPHRESRPPEPRGSEGPGRETTELTTFHWENKTWRAIKIDGRGYRLVGAVDQTPALAELRGFRTLFLLGIPISLALIAIGAWIVVDRALRPIRTISNAASKITAADLSERIPESPHTDSEITDLIEVLNHMIKRLEGSFRHANRFSADVSHELKTPIAIMQGEIESAIRECDPDSGAHDKFVIAREEVQRLKEIIESLMLLAKADVGQLVHRHETIDLSEELEGLVEDAEILALPKSITISADISSGISFEGDVVLLRQAFLNLITNAVRYNFDDGSIKIAMKASDRKGQIRMRVANTGPPIPEDEQSLVFDRFHRVDKSRSRNTEGFGLGLSLVQEIIEGHGGRIWLVESTLEQTLFEITLPLAPS
ncbi:MAG: ATP-binding protein [Verrucomicrobiales bacterium]|nr:ATP-binding protein [Verrucomicrobiales bacterium]